MGGAISGKNNVYKAKGTGIAYLQFLYYDPVSNKNKPLPKGTPITVQFIDDANTEKSKNTKLISNSEGKITFEVESEVDVNLRFSIEFSADHYINVTKGTLMLKDSLDQAIQRDEFYLSKEMVFLLPKKTTLQNSSWEVGQMPTGSNAPTYDSANFRFRGLNKNKRLEGIKDFLKIILKPEWQYVRLNYYDKYSKAEASVPQFIMLEGHINNNLIARSNLYRDKCICLPWIEKANQSSIRDKTKTILKFEANTADANDTFFIYSGAFSYSLVKEKISDVRKKSLSDRRKYYDVPRKWSSKNWIVSIGNETKIFSDMANDNTTLTNPLIFDLDSIVFTVADLKCKDWDITHRFTAFDPKIAIAGPDTDKPYLTKTNPLKGTMLTRVETGNETRLVALNSVFYDVTDKRSDAGTVVDIIGARAAVENDSDLHHHKTGLQDPGNKFAPFTSGYELHYLADCLDTGGNLSSVILIYWSCKYVTDGTTQADIDNFNKFGMTNAKARWERKGYLFKSGKIVVRPVFFFESRDIDPKKAEVKINNSSRADMIDYLKSDYQEQPPPAMTDADSNNFAWFTMAHELGHSVGLYDEYLEPITIGAYDTWNPILPNINQAYPEGGYYLFDEIAIMRRNMAPRLRHFWFFCRWLNEESDAQKIVKAKNNLANNVAFKVVYESQNFEYSLPTTYNNYYTPAGLEDNKSNGTYGRLSLYLYKIGNDETDKLMITGMKGFDSILFVRPEICMDFTMCTDSGTPPHDHDWTDDNEKAGYIASFHNTSATLNGKYYIEIKNSADFKKTYVYCVPHYYFGASTNPAGHKTAPVFQMYVNSNNVVVGRPDIIYAPQFFGDGFIDHEFNVDKNHNKINIFRYILGLTVYESPSIQGNFTVGGVTQENLNKLDTTQKIEDSLFNKFVGENALHKIPAYNVNVVEAGSKWAIVDRKTDGGVYQEIKYTVERTESKIGVSGRATFGLESVEQINVNSLNSLSITQAIKDLFKAKSNELKSPVVTMIEKNSKWKITDTIDTGNVEYNLEVQEIKLNVKRDSIKKAINTINIADLKFLADWVKAKLAGTIECTIKSK